MSEFTEIYEEFWNDYEATTLGPRDFAYGPLKEKAGNAGYRKFPHRFSLGFYPVVTLRLQGGSAGAIGVELISSSTQGRDFLSNTFNKLHEVALGNTLAKAHIKSSEWKIELLWHNAMFEDVTRRAAHILWINLAIHTLALAYAEPLEEFDKRCPK